LYFYNCRCNRNIPRVDLLASELRYFHRPHLSVNQYNKSWIGTYSPPANAYASQTQAGAFQNKDSKASGSVSTGAGHQHAQTQAIDKNDLSLLTGDFVLIEYIEEKPPLILNVGMASSIVNYYRTLADAGGSAGSNADTTRSSGSNAADNLSHRVPQHVVQLLAKRNITSFAESEENGPRLAVGETKILDSRPNPVPDSIVSNVANDDQNSAAVEEQLTYLSNLQDVNQIGPFLGSKLFVCLLVCLSV